MLEGKTDIAATSRAMKESEKAAFEQRTGTRPIEIVIALDPIGVYVHNNNPVTRLTLAQLKSILTGEIRNWRDVGGLNRRINFYNRDKNSGTRVFILDHVLAGKPFSNNAIGYVIQKIRKLSLRIGEDVTVPVTLGSNFSMEFVIRKSLIGKTSPSCRNKRISGRHRLHCAPDCFLCGSAIKRDAANSRRRPIERGSVSASRRQAGPRP